MKFLKYVMLSTLMLVTIGVQAGPMVKAAAEITSAVATGVSKVAGGVSDWAKS